MSATDFQVEELQARIELLENALKDANGFILAKFAFDNNPEAIEIAKVIQDALWPMPERWRKGNDQV